MSHNYYHISVPEFEAVIDDYDGEQVQMRGTREFVYDLPTAKDGLVVRVFSSLEGDGARDAGRDAIRAFAWSRTADTAVARAKRTHRIDTWESNFRPKVEALIERVEAGEFDDATPDATLAGLVPAAHDEDGVVTVEELVDTRYGRKAVLASPYDAKDAIKAMDWDETHRAWDSDRNAWTVDVDALPTVDAHLADAGWPLRGPRMDDPEAFDFDALADTVLTDDHIVVTYHPKTGGDPKQKAGRVVRVDAARVMFERDDDGHLMSVEPEGLRTSGSAYPFVGEVESVTRDGWVTDDGELVDGDAYGDFERTF